jgi:catechol 2,3-dioxygenase-like lactoylglutathione lyase family enzyme
VTEKASMSDSGGLSHVGLRCEDLARTEQFYCHVLGANVLQRRDEPDRRIWMDVRGVRFEIAETARMPAISEDQRRVLPTISFLVAPAEVDEIVARLRAGSVPFREPMLKATGRSVGVYFADPDGNPLSLSCPEGYAREGLKRSVRNAWVAAPYDWKASPPTSAGS